MLSAFKLGVSNTCADDPDSLRARLTTCVCKFSHHLASQRSGCLAQIWVPGVREDGSVTLHTQVKVATVQDVARKFLQQLALSHCIRVFNVDLVFVSTVFVDQVRHVDTPDSFPT